MKLVTFRNNGSSRLGALVSRDGQDMVVDLSEAGLPTDMIAFLNGGDALRSRAEKALSGKALKLSAVKLSAPSPRPGKVICIGLNYRDHAIETHSPMQDYPVAFTKYANAVIGPGDAIVLPRVTEKVDYEAELGFVIGRKGRYIAERDAMSYVAGYLPVNDVSARDYQTRVSQ